MKQLAPSFDCVALFASPTIAGATRTDFVQTGRWQYISASALFQGPT